MENLPLVTKGNGGQVQIGPYRLGGGDFLIIAGPCALESREQTLEAARLVKGAGAQAFRGGAYKPRTSPYGFPGLAAAGLKLLEEVGKTYDFPVVTEVVDAQDVELVARYADVLQVGARNMQNFSLLKALGQLRKPIILKRGFAATIAEWLAAAEYIMVGGNRQVILCERGIRTYEGATRNTLDLSAVAVVKRQTDLPVIVDPSHGTGRRELILPMAKAAVAAGADGLLIEVHPQPERALCDGRQSLTGTEFQRLMAELKPYIAAAGKVLPSPSPVEIQPSRERFIQLAREGNIIPLSCTLPADLETPMSAFLKLQDCSHPFLLESVTGGEQLGRYSFLGADPFLILRSREETITITQGDETRHRRGDPLAVLEEILASFCPVIIPGLPPLAGGAVGYLGYDLVSFSAGIPYRAKDGDLPVPDMYLIFPRLIIAFDHVLQQMQLICSLPLQGSPEETYVQGKAYLEWIMKKLQGPMPRVIPIQEGSQAGAGSSYTKGDFVAAVAELQMRIKAGELEQGVLSRRVDLPLKEPPLEIYRRLRRINPSPYLFFLHWDDVQLIGSSPESLVKVIDGKVELRPIAGTSPRGRTPAEDEALCREMLADAKERMEHAMLVDLGKGDLAPICREGSIEMTESMAVEKYSHVAHLVSRLQGQLRPGVGPVDVLRSTFPAGTVSGVPKKRAMELIGDLEPVNRGPYGGIVGYMDFAGNMDTCITIRTIICHGGRAYIQAGAGIVALSQPEKEYLEIETKLAALIQALGYGE